MKLLILSDIHSNWAALQSVLEAESDSDKILCLGDLVDYGPDFLFFGHTHWPLSRRIGSTTIVNPGSVGQPKDGDPRAAYAVCEDGNVKLRRVAYPIDAIVAAYARTPLASSDVESLLAVLRTGGTLPSTGVAELAIQ
jgi:predicted phosphodiesterase